MRAAFGYRDQSARLRVGVICTCFVTLFRSPLHILVYSQLCLNPYLSVDIENYGFHRVWVPKEVNIGCLWQAGDFFYGCKYYIRLFMSEISDMSWFQ